MITKISSENRYHSKHEWLSTFHLFSFADYYDSTNMNFGVLRVFNDDTIDRKSGFPTHGHKNMEIITIILEGELTHKDTMGNTEVIKKGEVQYMSAGTGVMHSEFNNSKEKIHLYQIWLTPIKNNLSPKYTQKDFSNNIKSNSLTPVVSNSKLENSITIQADATRYLGDFEAGKIITHQQKIGYGIFIYVTKGSVNINEVLFKQGDQARIVDENSITIISLEETKYIIIDTAL